MNKNFEFCVRKFVSDHPNATFAVAVSGGADSTALLYMMKESGFPMVALTVDHNLRADSAKEAQYVAEICKKIGVSHHILEWTGKKPARGIEEAARRARYDLLSGFCKKNGVGVLVTAHHADDQIETFLMNLGRGSGAYGLAGMRERSERDGVIIFRPLLSVPRAELIKYCDTAKIKYFNDEMNEDEKFLRVRIRKNRHALADMGISDERILRTMENMARLRDRIDAEADKFVKKIPVELDASMLLNLPDEVRFRALSKMLSDEYPIRLDDIKNAFGKLDGKDCKFTLANCNIRKLNGKIRIWKEGTSWQKHPRK